MTNWTPADGPRPMDALEWAAMEASRHGTTDPMATIRRGPRITVTPGRQVRHAVTHHTVTALPTRRMRRIKTRARRIIRRVAAAGAIGFLMLLAALALMPTTAAIPVALTTAGLYLLVHTR